MDVLADVVTTLRTGPATSARTDARGPWGMRFAHSFGATFHVILQGNAWLLPDGVEPIALGPGDVVLLPRGLEHALADHPSSPIATFDPAATEWPQGQGPRSLVLCGTYRLDRERPHPVLSKLPDVVVVPASPGKHRTLHRAISILGEELDAQEPGAAAVVPALVDALLVLILRAWFEDNECPTDRGWARALTDPAVARSLELIHEKPGAAWTVAELAAHVGLSRAAFARRFTEAVGEPPLTYLARWRMTTAARLLRDLDRPLATVAKEIGYTSEFAFAKAFKRDFGVPPGTYRKQLTPA
ncbi:AraC family transcriptional regulator [Kribbella sp. NPDC026611]|uniref:AraC family transcriptional regulator n=1 Tax=Kribbella sp. NPDC026611 TaxID=3154911 RepID=UPI0033F46E92